MGLSQTIAWLCWTAISVDGGRVSRRDLSQAAPEEPLQLSAIDPSTGEPSFLSVSRLRMAIGRNHLDGPEVMDPRTNVSPGPTAFLQPTLFACGAHARAHSHAVRNTHTTLSLPGGLGQ